MNAVLTASSPLSSRLWHLNKALDRPPHTDQSNWRLLDRRTAPVSTALGDEESKMIIEPPENSNISVDKKMGQPKIIIDNGSGGIMRIFLSLFLICWLGGWAVGWVSTAKQIISGKSGADFFLIFWICGWTVGGIFAIWFLYRLLRPSMPETLSLEAKQIEYDSGIKPFKMSFGFVGMNDYWKQMFPKRKICSISFTNLSTLQLREHSSPEIARKINIGNLSSNFSK